MLWYAPPVGRPWIALQARISRYAPPEPSPSGVAAVSRIGRVMPHFSAIASIPSSWPATPPSTRTFSRPETDGSAGLKARTIAAFTSLLARASMFSGPIEPLIEL